LLLGGEFLESKKPMPEAKRTPEGKYRCPTDNQEYDTKEDYEAHCEEEHSEM
jgi:hypothetical protein